MKAEITYNIKIIGDDNKTKVLEPEDLFTIGKDNLSEQARIEFDLAASAANVEQKCSQINSANILLIVVTENCSVRFNANDGEEIDIVADKLTGSTKYGLLMLTTTGITSVFLTNKSTSIAKVRMLYAS